MKKRNLALIVITLMLTVVTGYFVSQTYARYVFKTSGTAKTTAAAWVINVTDGTNKYENNFTLNATREATDYVAADKIAPGTTGSFNIVIDPTGTEVAFNYSVKIGQPENTTALPEGLKFYLGDISDNNLLTIGTASEPTLKKLTNKAAFTEADKIETKISWKWEDLDTEEANKADTDFQSQSVSFPVEIVIEQAIQQ